VAHAAQHLDQVQPPNQRTVGAKSWRLSMQENENGLSNVFRETRITQSAFGHSQDPADVVSDELAESLLVSVSVLFQQFNVVHPIMISSSDESGQNSPNICKGERLTQWNRLAAELAGE
jgi:hypothetical protein